MNSKKFQALIDGAKVERDASKIRREELEEVLAPLLASLLLVEDGDQERLNGFLAMYISCWLRENEISSMTVIDPSTDRRVVQVKLCENKMEAMDMQELKFLGDDTFH